jgi:hypothetical protein
MENVVNNLRKIKDDFAAIGARVQVVPYTSGNDLFKYRVAEVNVSEDTRGEFFEITISRDILENLRVLRIDRETNQLILVASTDIHFLCAANDSALSIEYIFRPDKNKETAKRSSFNKVSGKAANTRIVHVKTMTGIYGRNAVVAKNLIN